MIKVFGIFLLTFMLTNVVLQGQTYTAKYKKTNIALNEPLQLLVEAQGGQIRNINGVPVIEGFQRTGNSSSSNMAMVNGQMSFSYTVTINYMPQEEGVFDVPSFTLNVDGRKVITPDITVEVGPARQARRQRRRGFFDPFGMDPFGADPFGLYEEPEYVDIKADAFFALNVSKKEVYVGEAVHANLAFYIAEQHQAYIDFHDLYNQLMGMIPKLKPSNAWEENFTILEVKGEKTDIRGKPYLRYKLFESVFFPLTAEDLTFPKVGLEMVTYKKAKRMSFMAPNIQKDYKTFYTKAQKVNVKPLPDHPLKDIVSVGQFKLEEELTDSATTTGEGVTYLFQVKGTGNISSIPEPTKNSVPHLTVFDPSIYQEIKRNYGKVFGSKAFEYYLVPNQEDTFSLREVFSWIYFDPERARYDTLRPSSVLLSNSNGSAASISNFIRDPFYRRMEDEANHLNTRKKGNFDMWVGFGLVILISFSTFGIAWGIKNRKKNGLK